ncbi:exonuclease domain-containing protein [Echinicola vietnamensis]|uniref:Exonuclease, DNA polymerase III, epsilon subunit family n=1 Tax=Echinicola vietnamensis (strain DSM 17526 / LMG 23754 / KMM 6221) TaxID=926556 RepID=L0G1B7_ECHVK|nr:exonuclease domain-containing protein [Echinicola vietnamensis]AGA78806.1 exonuclease, DNA polymerase III, epsilon subunit family [Echinicola vietnamensis DSM 17526]
MIYAIVDIETTGGYGKRHRITEVAAVAHNGSQILDSFQTLINPDCEIPGFITGLTGIDQSMVEGAPYFEDIADELYAFLEDKIFVAHNVNFDYQFIRSEFERIGKSFDRPKLCTVRLSRKIFPGLRSYSLGRICEHKNIEIKSRHRAFGDAEATAELFTKLLLADQEGIVEQLLKRNSGEAFLPPNITKEQFLSLPESIGVYYFHDANGKVIYVGKALNIRHRFKGHFSGAGKGKQGMKSAIYDVSFQLTGSEFLALLVEALEIKQHWPKYNRAQKAKNAPWGIYRYQDGQGFERFQVAKINRFTKPLLAFHSHHEAWSYLLEKIEKHQLCAKLCGVQKSASACFDHQAGACLGACCGEEEPSSYNTRVEDWLQEIQREKSRLLIREKGRHPNEQAAIYFEDGVLKAYGFIDSEAEFDTDEAVIDQLEMVKPVGDTSSILAQYLSKNLMKKVVVLPS